MPFLDGLSHGNHHAEEQQAGYVSSRSKACQKGEPVGEVILCCRYWSPDLYPMRGARVAVPDTTVNDYLPIGGFTFNVDSFDETCVNLIITDGVEMMSLLLNQARTILFFKC